MTSEISPIDSYEQFFELCSKQKLFEFGLEKIISIEKKKARVLWDELKEKIEKKSDEIHVRSFGRNASGNAELEKMYNKVFGININFDHSNNAKPTQMLQNATGYRKKKTIFNYQVAHVFGRTKNIYCFTAPWNVVFIPKIVDPFTGHEATGAYVEEFKANFSRKIYALYRDMIEEYNSIMRERAPEVEKRLRCKGNDASKVDDILKNFEEIKI